jgi:hypothetical protein
MCWSGQSAVSNELNQALERARQAGARRRAANRAAHQQAIKRAETIANGPAGAGAEVPLPQKEVPASAPQETGHQQTQSVSLTQQTDQADITSIAEGWDLVRPPASVICRL